MDQMKVQTDQESMDREGVGRTGAYDGPGIVGGPENLVAVVESGNLREDNCGPYEDANESVSPVAGVDTISPDAGEDGPKDEPGDLDADLNSGTND